MARTEAADGPGAGRSMRARRRFKRPTDKPSPAPRESLVGATSLLELQLASIVEDASIATDASTPTGRLLASLPGWLRALPEAKIAWTEADASESSWLAGLRTPTPLALPFAPPTCVFPVGLAALKAACWSAPAFELAMEMPGRVQEKDRLNSRYHAKRALYLAHVARELRACPGVARVEWTCLRGDGRLPVLKVFAEGTEAVDAGPRRVSPCIVLRPVPRPSTFVLRRLAPDRNNVRSVRREAPALRRGEPAPLEESLLLPTPYYNASILADQQLALHQARLTRLLARCGASASALRLVLVWAEGWGLLEGTDAWTPELFAVLLAAMLQRGVLAVSASPGIAFRALLVQLAGAKVFKTTLDLEALLRDEVQGGEEEEEDEEEEDEEEEEAEEEEVEEEEEENHSSDEMEDAFSDQSSEEEEQDGLDDENDAAMTALLRASSDACLPDATGWVNLAAGLSRGVVLATRAAAAHSLLLFNRGSPAAVAAALPAAPAPALAAADAVLHVDVAAVEGAAEGLLSGDEAGLRALERRVERLATQALGTRALWVRVVGRDAGEDDVPGTGGADAAENGRDGELGRRTPGKSKRRVSALGPGAKKLKRGSATVQDPLVPAWLAQPFSHSLCILVRLHPSEGLRAVDVGPPADSGAPAAAFRAFWGAASQLRRFKDGAMAEAVAWGGPSGARHVTPDRVVGAALARHLSGASVRGTSHVLDAALERGEEEGGEQREEEEGRDEEEEDSPFVLGALGESPLPPQPWSPALLSSLYSSAEAEASRRRALAAASERLSSQLRSLREPVLKIVAVQPASLHLRHTSLFAPSPHPLAAPTPAASAAPLPRCLDPVRLLCTLEHSGRWPEDPRALAAARAALACHLAELLGSTHGLWAQADRRGHVDVLAEGWAFRLVLNSGREGRSGAQGDGQIVSQDSQISAKDSQISAKDSQISAKDSQNPEGDSQASTDPPSTTLPYISAALHSMHSGAISAVAGRHPAYAPAARLALRWARAHLLLGEGLLSEPAVELLAAHAFVRDGREESAASGAPTSMAPASRTSGFLAFLRLLSQHPWSVEELRVDCLEDAASGGIRQGGGGKATSPAPGPAAMRLVTPYDPSGEAWTAQGPSRPLLARLSVLARRSAAALSNALGAPSERRRQESLRALWSVDLRGYDALLLLRPQAVPFAGERAGREGGMAALDARALEAAEAGQSAACAALSAVLGAEHAASADWAGARAVLRGIPRAVAARHSTEALLRQLLVDVDPVGLFAARLSRRFGASLVACADGRGLPLVALKWRAAEVVPGRRRELGGAEAPGEANPVKAAALLDAMALGAGLVDRVVVLAE